MRHRRRPLCCLALPAPGRGAASAADQARWPEPASGWALQPATKVNASGQALSQVGGQTVGWQAVEVLAERWNAGGGTR